MPDFAISVPHPRVEEGGYDVHREVRERDEDGDERDYALNGDEVTGAEVLRELEPESLPFEGGLREDGTPEEQGDLQPDDRDDGDEGGLEGMSPDQPVFAHAT